MNKTGEPNHEVSTRSPRGVPQRRGSVLIACYSVINRVITLRVSKVYRFNNNLITLSVVCLVTL